MTEVGIFRYLVRDNILLICPTQNIRSLAIPEIHQEWEQIMLRLRSPDVAHVIWNLGKVEYIGSAMVEAMNLSWKVIRDAAGRLAVCCASAIALDILLLSCFERIWSFCETQQEAFEVVNAVG